MIKQLMILVLVQFVLGQQTQEGEPYSKIHGLGTLQLIVYTEEQNLPSGHFSQQTLTGTAKTAQ